MTHAETRAPVRLHVPVLKQGDLLIVSIQDALTDADMLAMRDRVVAEVSRHRSRSVVFDVTGLDVVDSFAVHTLSETAQMLRLRGAATLLVGIQSNVALAMVRLRLALAGIHVMLDLEDALGFLARIPPPRAHDAR